MQINTPTVGPIVGHTTAVQSRILLRGKEGNSLAAFAVARIRERGTTDWSTPIFNELKPSNDMSAVLVFNNLKADTVYEYQAGWFNAASSLDKIAVQSRGKLAWSDTIPVLKTASADPRARTHYMVGSCRYIHTNRLTGAPVLPDIGDQVFKVMNHKITQKRMPIDALFMVGDQIYADDLNLVTPSNTLEDFLSRYRTAFTQKGIGKMLAHVPTYMTLDDHEIEDNWPAKATEKDWAQVYPAAMKAYSIYQCSHGPVHGACADGQQIVPANKPKDLWYTLSNGGTEWFVLDVRTERDLKSKPRKLLGEQQMKALLDWLKTSKAHWKFVVSAVMVYPDLKQDDGDSWKSFPDQRNLILEHIRLNKIRNVVFVSGDVHCSLVSRMTHSADPDFVVHTVVSSPLYKIPILATYAYAYKDDFVLDKPEATVGGQHYRSTLVSKVHSEDNFAYFSVDTTGIELQFYDKNGQELEKKPVMISAR